MTCVSKPGGLICSTSRAHKLLYKAWNIGGQTIQQALLDGLFKANFYNKIDISNKHVLAAIGEKAGVMSKQEVRNFNADSPFADLPPDS